MVQQKKPIVLLGPMVSETAVLIDSLEHPAEQMIGAYRFVSGTVDNYPVIVGRTYIGMVNSAAAATVAIERFDPLYVILQGTSGAHHPDLHRGDIVLGDNIVHIGRYFTSHLDSGMGSDYTRWTYPGTEIVTGGGLKEITVLHSDPFLMDIAASVPYSHGKVIRGAIGAADIWNRELDMIAHLRETLGTDCEEMEGFAVAQVCAQLGVRCADIRIISNSERYPDEAFDEGYGRTCQDFCLDVIKKLIASF